jgi:hypothetical protein
MYGTEFQCAESDHVISVLSSGGVNPGSPA